MLLIQTILYIRRIINRKKTHNKTLDYLYKLKIRGNSKMRMFKNF